MKLILHYIGSGLDVYNTKPLGVPYVYNNLLYAYAGYSPNDTIDNKMADFTKIDIICPNIVMQEQYLITNN